MNTWYQKAYVRETRLSLFEIGSLCQPGTQTERVAEIKPMLDIITKISTQNFKTKYKYSMSGSIGIQKCSYLKLNIQ